MKTADGNKPVKVKAVKVRAVKTDDKTESNAASGKVQEAPAELADIIMNAIPEDMREKFSSIEDVMAELSRERENSQQGAESKTPEMPVADMCGIEPDTSPLELSESFLKVPQIPSLGESPEKSGSMIEDIAFPEIDREKAVADLKNMFKEENIEIEEAFEIDDTNNMAVGKNGTLIKYIGSTEIIMIPDNITSIGKYAFRGNETVKKIIMSDSVKMIDKFAFAHCPNLEEIIFSRNLETIGDNAFLKCRKLKEVSFPDSLKNLGKGAFGKCGTLKRVIFPKDLKKISDLCFFSCKSLSRIMIPSSVEIIGNSAFSECYGLKKVTIKNSVTSIGESAFSWCKSLEEIVIPSSVRTINSWAFYGCQSLVTVTISLTTRDIREDAFSGCENIYNVKIAEFEGDEHLSPDAERKGHRLTYKIFRQVNRQKAERYAREHNLNTLFI